MQYFYYSSLQVTEEIKFQPPEKQLDVFWTIWCTPQWLTYKVQNMEESHCFNKIMNVYMTNCVHFVAWLLY